MIVLRTPVDIYSGGIAGHVDNGSSITGCAAINNTIHGTRSRTGRIAGDIAGDATISNNFALATMTAMGCAFAADIRNHGVDKNRR